MASIKKNLYVPAPTVGNMLDVERELRRIQDSFSTVSDHIVTETTTSAPDKDVQFQMRYADGVNWNPRGLGAGLYIFIGTEWKKITLT